MNDYLTRDCNSNGFFTHEILSIMQNKCKITKRTDKTLVILQKITVWI